MNPRKNKISTPPQNLETSKKRDETETLADTSKDILITHLRNQLNEIHELKSHALESMAERYEQLHQQNVILQRKYERMDSALQEQNDMYKQLQKKHAQLQRRFAKYETFENSVPFKVLKKAKHLLK